MSSYIQCSNFDRDLIFLNLETESLHWILPEDASFLDVLYIAHPADTNKYYYEYLPDGSTVWKLPESLFGQTISPEIEKIIVALGSIMREEVEELSGEKYEEEAAEAQRDLFLDFLEFKEKDPRYSKRISMSQLGLLGLAAYGEGGSAVSRSVQPQTNLVVPPLTKTPSTSSTSSTNMKKRDKQVVLDEEFSALPSSTLQKNEQGVLELAVVKVRHPVLFRLIR